LQRTGRDVASQRRELLRHRAETCVDAPLAAHHLRIDGLDRVRQQERRLVPAEELVTVEVPVRERLGDTQRCQAGGGVGGPVVGRHVREAEATVSQACHRVGAAGVRVRAGEEPVDEQRGLVPGHRALAEERSIRETGVEVRFGQLAERTSAPLIAPHLADANRQDQQDHQRQQPLRHRSTHPSGSPASSDQRSRRRFRPLRAFTHLSHHVLAQHDRRVTPSDHAVLAVG
jgi:hypothetical protein